MHDACVYNSPLSVLSHILLFFYPTSHQQAGPPTWFWSCLRFLPVQRELFQVRLWVSVKLEGSELNFRMRLSRKCAMGENKQKSVLKLGSEITTNLPVWACVHVSMCTRGSVWHSPYRQSAKHTHVHTVVKIIEGEQRHPWSSLLSGQMISGF